MPRETVRMKNEDNVFDVRVGWTKDSYMQIGLEEKDERSLAWQLFEHKAERIGEEIYAAIDQGIYTEDFTVKLDNVNNKLLINEERRSPTNEELGKIVLNILDVVTHGPVAGIWTTPSRTEVNDLIRLLRRARDSAFGRDE